MVSLLGAHVLGRAQHHTDLGEHRIVSEPAPRGFCQSKIDDLWYRLVVLLEDQHVGGLQIAVDDRFLMRVRMGYPDSSAEREILRSEAGAAQLDMMEPVLNGADVMEVQEAVTQVRVDESLVSYALSIVRRTRESEHFTLGVSPRGAQMLYRAAQAMAFLDGRSFCTPEDFKPLAVPVFAHRVTVNGTSSGLKKSDPADHMISEIVDSIPVPI